MFSKSDTHFDFRRVHGYLGCMCLKLNVLIKLYKHTLMKYFSKDKQKKIFERLVNESTY
jgi:hypothetical protein